MQYRDERDRCTFDPEDSWPERDGRETCSERHFELAVREAPFRADQKSHRITGEKPGLRGHVSGLVAGFRQVEKAPPAWMDEVRQQLQDAGYYIRKINQAYFAWYGTYAARPDATDPLGGYLREIRQRTGSLTAFLDEIRGWTSRRQVEDGLVDLGGTLQPPQ